MAEVTSGHNLTVIVLDKVESETLAETLINYVTAFGGVPSVLFSLCEALGVETE